MEMRIFSDVLLKKIQQREAENHKDCNVQRKCKGRSGAVDIVGQLWARNQRVSGRATLSRSNCRYSHNCKSVCLVYPKTQSVVRCTVPGHNVGGGEAKDCPAGAVVVTLGIAGARSK
jgi:hypothetical protein